MALGNGCNHVTVITENLDRFIAFYRDVFEAEVVLDLSEGDMRHALNNFQACVFMTSGGMVNQSNVFKVCDQPHPKTLGEIVASCQKGDTVTAVQKMKGLWQTGYAPSDIIGTLFKVVKAHKDLPEALKLEYLREIGFTHMRIADGVNTLLQLLGLLGRLSQKASVGAKQ